MSKLASTRLCNNQSQGFTQADDVEACEGISCEVIDLRTLLPWDVPTVGAHILYPVLFAWKNLELPLDGGKVTRADGVAEVSAGCPVMGIYIQVGLDDVSIYAMLTLLLLAA